MTAWAAQESTQLPAVSEAAPQLPGRRPARLELEWLRLVPMEVAREYLMSIRGAQPSSGVCMRTADLAKLFLV